MKKFTWVSSNGNVFELEAECTTTISKKIYNVDGVEVKSLKTETYTEAMLIAKIDGRKIDSSQDISFWEVIDSHMPGVKKIWGIGGIGFLEDKAVDIANFLKDVIESGKSEEVKEFETFKLEQKRAREIKAAREIVEKAEKQTSVPTYKEARAKERSYNNLFNEGGEGYVPHVIDIEEYNRALAILNQ